MSRITNRISRNLAENTTKILTDVQALVAVIMVMVFLLAEVTSEVAAGAVGINAALFVLFQRLVAAPIEHDAALRTFTQVERDTLDKAER